MAEKLAEVLLDLKLRECTTQLEKNFRQLKILNIIYTERLKEYFELRDAYDSVKESINNLGDITEEWERQVGLGENSLPPLEDWEADGDPVLVADDKARQLEFRDELGRQLGVIPGDEKFTQWGIKPPPTLTVNETADDTSYVREIKTDLGAGSLLSVPLLLKERAVGVISALKTFRETRFAATHPEFLSVLAKQATITTENASLFKSVVKQRQELEMLLGKAIQSQENERKRVAVEIHDSIGQQIIAVLYRVQNFTLLLSQSKHLDARIEADEIRRLLEGTVRELRQVLAGLRADRLDELGLVSALRHEAERFTRETNTACRFTVDGSSADLTSSQEAAIYRVAQETLTNVRKHAHATAVSVGLRYQPGAVSLTVSDNGKGFEVDQTNSSVPLGHMGLTGMRERAGMLGGNLSISSSPGNGTSVVLTIPLTKRN